MRIGYEKQILNHYLEKFTWMVKADLDMLSLIKALIQANKNAELQLNSVNGANEMIKDLK